MLVEREQIESKKFTCCVYKGEYDRQTQHILIPIDYWGNNMVYDEKIESLKNRFINNNFDYYFYDLQLPYDFKAPF